MSQPTEQFITIHVSISPLSGGASRVEQKSTAAPGKIPRKSAKKGSRQNSVTVFKNFCSIIGCERKVASKFFCAYHGGGQRCKFEGCDKLPNSRKKNNYSGFCFLHGGKIACEVESCQKFARGNGSRCVRHGGGKKCIEDGCLASMQSNLRCRRHVRMVFENAQQRLSD